ncbi:MAG TPA: DUF503 domain-containing protein [Firmicutes bacterium]|jgi:uncharacterized protein YlxP (DUF503 family)|nr:DUF503 domain-containing protein [Bacillota bacterium]
MLVGLGKMDLLIAEGHSLKEKRQVTKSIIQRLQKRFNISVAETGYQDMHRRAEIGFALVSNETVYLDKKMQEIMAFLEGDGRVQQINFEREIIPFGG